MANSQGFWDEEKTPTRKERKRNRKKYRQQHSQSEQPVGTGQSTQHQVHKCKINWPSVPQLIISFVILLAAILTAIYTAGVYAEIGAWISGSRDYIRWGDLGASQVHDWFLIGWPLELILWASAKILHFLQLTLLGVVFVLLFFVLQTLEVAPSLVKGSRVLMGRIIARINAHKSLPINKNEDDYTTVELKESYNQYYSSVLKELKAWRFRAYVIDFLIMVTLMPIVTTSDGPMRLFEAVGRIDFSSSDLMPTAFFRLLCSMWLIQLIVSISIFVRKGAQFIKD